jgi:SAM-dependent methyltransferase
VRQPPAGQSVCVSQMPHSVWAEVDRAGNADRLIVGLDRLRAEPFFAQSKARMDALLPSGDAFRLVDVGCGTGEDTLAARRSGHALVLGIERSIRMTAEARRRHPTLLVLAADGRQLPLADGSVDAVRADRVLQHISGGSAALTEWRRVLRLGGVVISFDPDLTTAAIDGTDQGLAARVLAWRAATRPGADTVQTLAHAFGGAGFHDVLIERRLLDLGSLDRADGIMGLADWGHQAAATGAISRADARRWSDDVRSAHHDRSLRYRCVYLLGVGHALS